MKTLLFELRMPPLITLKTIAQELNVPVLASIQLPRTINQVSDKRPTLANLQDIGPIEESADVVMLIHNPELHENINNQLGVVEIIIAKHSNGPVGSIELIFHQMISKFENAVQRKVSNDDLSLR